MKDKIKQLKLSDNLTDNGEEKTDKEIKPKKEKDKPANKLWIIVILVITVLVSVLFKYVLGDKASLSKGVQIQENQSGEYAL